MLFWLSGFRNLFGGSDLLGSFMGHGVPVFLLFFVGHGMIFAGSMVCVCTPESLQTTGVLVLAAAFAFVPGLVPFSIWLLGVYVGRVGRGVGDTELANQSWWFVRVTIYYVAASLLGACSLGCVVDLGNTTSLVTWEIYLATGAVLAMSLVGWFVWLLWRTRTTIQRHVQKHFEPHRYEDPFEE